MKTKTLNMANDELDETAPLNAMVSGSYKVSKTPQISERKDFSPLFRQIFAACGPISGSLSAGMTAGFSAMLLDQLDKPDTDIEITREEGSWIASMAPLPMALGCLLSGYMMDRFGRRITHIIVSIPFIIGWLVLATAPNILALYIGRFITGLCVGLLSPPGQVYIAETSHPAYRGALLCAVSLAVSLGILMSHVFGTFLSWKIVAGASAIPAVMCCLIMSFVPETPSWFFSKDEMVKGESSFRWFRGYSEEADAELDSILKKTTKVFSIPEFVAAPEVEVNEQSQFKKIKKLLIKSSFLKPFLILNVFFFVQQFSGVNAVAFYSVNLLEEVVAGINKYVATITIDIVRSIMSLLAVVLLKKHGRRSLAIISSIGSAISLFTLAGYLAFVSLETSEPGFKPRDLLPLISLISYICFVSIGLVPLPWMLSGEIFSRDTRGLGSGISSAFGFICFFLVVKTSPNLLSILGNAGCFAFYGAICIFGVFHLYFFLPETKDKTLLEIEAHFKSKKSELRDENSKV